MVKNCSQCKLYEQGICLVGGDTTKPRKCELSLPRKQHSTHKRVHVSGSKTGLRVDKYVNKRVNFFVTNQYGKKMKLGTVTKVVGNTLHVKVGKTIHHVPWKKAVLI